MKKDGVDNFSFEVIEQVDDNQLNDREEYWISYYNSFYNGYNMTKGGNSHNLKYNEKEIFELWNQGMNCKQIAHKLKAYPQTISNYLEKLEISKEDKVSRGVEYKSRRVEQYTLKGEYIQTFTSVSKASQSLKNNDSYTSNICNACKGKITCTLGFIWKYEDDDTPIKEFVKKVNKSQHHRERKVNQYSLDNEYIKTFDTLKEAQKAIGAKSVTSITNVCKGRSKTGYGYIWKYYDEDENFIDIPI